MASPLKIIPAKSCELFPNLPTMYPCKFGQNPTTGLEDKSVGKKLPCALCLSVVFFPDAP